MRKGVRGIGGRNFELGAQPFPGGKPKNSPLVLDQIWFVELVPLAGTGLATATLQVAMPGLNKNNPRGPKPRPCGWNRSIRRRCTSTPHFSACALTILLQVFSHVNRLSALIKG